MFGLTYTIEDDIFRRESLPCTWFLNLYPHHYHSIIQSFNHSITQSFKKHFNVETSIFNLQNDTIWILFQSQWKRTLLLLSIYDFWFMHALLKVPSEWWSSFPKQQQETERINQHLWVVLCQSMTCWIKHAPVMVRLFDTSVSPQHTHTHSTMYQTNQSQEAFNQYLINGTDTFSEFLNDLLLFQSMSCFFMTNFVSVLSWVKKHVEVLLSIYICYYWMYQHLNFNISSFLWSKETMWSYFDA